MTFGFSAGSAFGNKFGANTYGYYAQQSVTQPPPFLIGTYTNEFKADLLQQIHDKFASGFYQQAGQAAGFVENEVFKREFYAFKEQTYGATSGAFGASSAFGARPGFGAYGQSQATAPRLSQADNFNLKRMEPYEFRGFAGLHYKLNQTKEDENRIQQKMKEVYEKAALFMQNYQAIFDQIQELSEVQLSLRVFMLSGQEKQQSFQFGFSVALDGFYKRIQEIKVRLQRVSSAAPSAFSIDSDIAARVEQLGVQLAKLLQ